MLGKSVDSGGTYIAFVSKVVIIYCPLRSVAVWKAKESSSLLQLKCEVEHSVLLRPGLVGREMLSRRLE